MYPKPTPPKKKKRKQAPNFIREGNIPQRQMVCPKCCSKAPHVHMFSLVRKRQSSDFHSRIYILRPHPKFFNLRPQQHSWTFEATPPKRRAHHHQSLGRPNPSAGCIISSSASSTSGSGLFVETSWDWDRKPCEVPASRHHSLPAWGETHPLGEVSGHRGILNPRRLQRQGWHTFHL